MNLNILTTTYMRIIAAAVAATIIVIGALAVLVLTEIIPNPILGLFLDDPESSARYYPRDTLAYGWVTLYPEGGQREQMLDLWDRLNEVPWIEDQLDELMDQLENEYNLIVEEDVIPWAGPEISVGLLEERRKPVGMMTISVRDPETAKEFMKDWTNYLEDELSLDFEFEEEDEMLIWRDQDTAIAFILANEVLVTLAGEELGRTLDNTLDLISGEQDRTLADEADFQKARSQLSSRRFASLFINIKDSIDILPRDNLSSYDFQEMKSITESGDLPEWVGASAEWIDRGIVFEASAPNTERYGQDIQRLRDPAKLVPSETIGLLAATFNPDLDAWRERLDNYGSDEETAYETKSIYEGLYRALEQESERPSRQKEEPDISDILDVAIELVEAHTSVDLERDLINHLEGSIVIAVNDVDPTAIRGNPAEETINAIAILPYTAENEDALMDSLEELSDYLQDEVDLLELDVDSVNVGAENEAETFHPSSGSIDTTYTPGYVFHKNKLYFGTTEDALEEVIATQNGNVEPLSSDKEYQRAVGALPKEQQTLFWVSLERLIAHVDAWDTELTDDEFEALQSTAGSIAASANADEEQIRISVAVTLFPE